MQNRQERPLELRRWQHGAAFLLASALLVTRRPDAIFHPQFWAEDGHVWFADAYNLGWWAALFQAHTGYFQTLPRLGAALALLVPLTLAPLVLNVIAITIQALPVNLLLSSRSAQWGSLHFRALLASTYLVMPNRGEMSFGITESQWLLALGAFLILVTSVPRSRVGKAFDILILLLSGLTGPFCIVLLPFALILAWKQRDRWLWVRTAVLTALSLIQIWALFVVDPHGRREVALGATPALFARLLGGQVFLGTLLGGNRLATYSGLGVFVFLVCAAIGGTFLVVICFLRSRFQVRLFLMLGILLFALALISPTGAVSNGVFAWENLASGPGIRYWFFPTLAFAWSILWCLQSRNRALKIVSAILLCIMCFGIIRDWQYPAFPEMHFAYYAKQFESAPVGTAVTIPENPEGWTLRLIKR